MPQKEVKEKSYSASLEEKNKVQCNTFFPKDKDGCFSSKEEAMILSKRESESIGRRKISVVHTNNEGHVVLPLYISAEQNHFLEFFLSSGPLDLGRNDKIIENCCYMPLLSKHYKKILNSIGKLFKFFICLKTCDNKK